MKYSADITDTTTGETRRFETEIADYADVHDLLEYLWTDGNYSCDCNRSMDFVRASGSDEDPWEVTEAVGCSGKKNRFRVEELRLEDGIVIAVDRGR